MARTATPKKRRGLIVSAAKFSFNGVKYDRGDEFDPMELKLHDSKVIQLFRSRRIKFGEILLSFEDVQKRHKERMEEKLLQKEIQKSKSKKIEIDLTTSGGGWYSVFVNGVTVGDGKMRKDEATDYVEKYHPTLLESFKEKF